MFLIVLEVDGIPIEQRKYDTHSQVQNFMWNLERQYYEKGFNLEKMRDEPVVMSYVIKDEFEIKAWVHVFKNQA